MLNVAYSNSRLIELIKLKRIFLQQCFQTGGQDTLYTFDVKNSKECLKGIMLEITAEPSNPCSACELVENQTSVYKIIQQLVKLYVPRSWPTFLNNLTQLYKPYNDIDAGQHYSVSHVQRNMLIMPAVTLASRYCCTLHYTLQLHGFVIWLLILLNSSLLILFRLIYFKISKH